MSITRYFVNTLQNYGSEKSIGTRLRSKRIAPLLEMIAEVSAEFGFVNIIDIGGTETYWGIVEPEYLQKHNVNITIVNLPGNDMLNDHGCFKHVAADGCDLAQYADNSFHIAHSNSVIEHVGDWERMIRFAAELSRVAQKYFVQTPNYWFPIEPHFMAPIFHWLPKPTRVWLVSKYQIGHYKKAASISHAVSIVENARLLNRKMFQELFADADIVTERFFLLAKSLIAVKK